MKASKYYFDALINIINYYIIYCFETRNDAIPYMPFVKRGSKQSCLKSCNVICCNSIASQYIYGLNGTVYKKRPLELLTDVISMGFAMWQIMDELKEITTRNVTINKPVPKIKYKCGKTKKWQILSIAKGYI